MIQHFTSKSAKFQNSSKNDSPSGAWTPPGGTIFLSEILILVSSISHLSIVKKAKWFFDGKNLIFQNSKVENLTNLEILQWKRDLFNFLQAIIFDTFNLAYWDCLHMFCTGNTAGKQRIKLSWINSKASSFNTKLGKNEKIFILNHFYKFQRVIIIDKQMLSIWIFLHKLYAWNTTTNWTIM